MKPLFMSFSALSVGAMALSTTVIANSAAAQDFSCGNPYTVVAGDSLSAIAKQVYGSAGEFQIIYSANSAVIGPNPGVISTGMVLDIPCLDGESQSQANAEAIRRIQTTEQLDAPKDITVRVVTATDWAPYFDEGQAQGGMVTEITNVALAAAEGSPDYKIDFINDWGSHLQPLLTDHAYDFATAWYQPPCEIADQLGDDAKFMCSNFEWSEPVFEILLGYFSRVDDPLPTTHAELAGRSICRPEGYETWVLEEDGLVEPNISFGQEGLITGCMEGLLDGTYDVVVIAVDPGEGAVLELDARDRIMLNDGLTKAITLHPVIAKSHPNKDQMLAYMNSGINAIKDNGEWFSIVRRHLSAHREATQ